MSVIRTYKCDGCGAITRAYPDDWFQVEVERMARYNRKSALDFTFNRPKVTRHVCSVECCGLALAAAQEEVNALEIPA